MTEVNPSGPVHPIEAESYRILRSRIDLTALPPLTRAVTERVIHATADFDYVTDLVCDEAALAAGVAALRRDAPVIADVAMVASGITGYPVICKIGDSLAARLARTANLTLSAAAVRLAHGEAGPGAIWLVGCAPTALAEIMSQAGRARPGHRRPGGLRRRGRGQGRAAGQRPAGPEQHLGEGRFRGGRRGVQRPAAGWPGPGRRSAAEDDAP